MNRHGVGLILMLVYIMFISMILLVTAHLVANVTKVTTLVGTTQNNTQFEALALSRLRDDCFAASTLKIETPAWLQIDSGLQWYVDDAGLRRMDPSGDIQVFPFAAKMNHFEMLGSEVSIRLGERVVLLPQLTKGTP